MAGAKRSFRRDTPSTKPGAAVSPRRSESERISAHIAEFEANGGRIEVLGTTRVLQRIDAAPAGDAVAPPVKAPARTR